LYKNGRFLYDMKLVAGNEGMHNLVNWVHIIEDDDVAKFLRGSELVFTAGILNKSEDWLLSYAQRLYAAGTSAFVVNIGPYTKVIPKEVIKFCNEVNMPLFTIPWETRMVDMTRDFCRRIMSNEQVETRITTTMKNIIFNIGDIEYQVQQLERHGYARDGSFCFISIMLNNKNGLNPDLVLTRLGNMAERIVKRMQDLFIVFSYNEYLILVLVNFTDEEIKCFVPEFLDNCTTITNDWEMHFGISDNKMGVYNQKTNFEKALSAMEIAKKKDLSYCYYDELGIFKILYAVNDKTVLRGYYKEIVGKLEAYDAESDSNLMGVLLAYLSNNASLQAVAEQLFMHRNTVTNQLKKIEEITGYNPLEMEDKVKFQMALYIQTIL